MRVFPFQPLVPSSNEAAVALLSPPYDVVDAAEAASFITNKPRSLLAVSRPDAQHPELESTDPLVYESAASSLNKLIADDTLCRATRPTIYVYSQHTPSSHTQHGVVVTVAAADYDAGLIRRHEHTRPAKENDRTRLAETVRAHLGLVFLTHRPVPQIATLVAEVVDSVAPTFEVTTPDGVSHVVREVPSTMTDAVVAAFAQHVPVTYIADGHHRAASAARVARASSATPDSASAQFPAVLFASSDLKILPYHRVSTFVPDGFEAALNAAVGPLEKLSGAVETTRRGTVHIRLSSGWFAFTLPASTESASQTQNLDCARLQDTVLAPLLDVKDPRSCEHLSFVGGVHGVEELDRRVEQGKAAVAFALAPVDIRDLLDVSDRNEVMPPKSTWFEPKLWSGFFVHTF